jgi:6-phosphogluconate dehydrogenase
MKNTIVFVMGVSGVGKSTVGSLLSKKLNMPFFDGDDYHPEKNISKMSEGIPLNDEDRLGWLESLNALAKNELEKQGCVIACSALKSKYRVLLEKEIKAAVKWVYLHGSFEEVFQRMNNRANHFMSPQLLQSQFDTLEEPKNAIKIDINLSPSQIVEEITNKRTEKSQFGLFGLGVMGKSLSRNLANKGFKISIFNRHLDGVEEEVAHKFKNEFEELSEASPFDNVESFVKSLQRPRKIMLMVNAGKTIDAVIEDLLPFLSKDDILIDGGNSNYLKTQERADYLRSKNINFIGAGVSGGEAGALKGPSIMPSGTIESYKAVQPFLEAIAAKDQNNLPCCTHIGTGGSGHFVKMVHNGIEYVEMQLLAEVCTILSRLGNNLDEIARILESWKTTVDSYLLEITIEILRKKEGGDWLINKIMDKAGNKGTGNWATIATAELGMPSTMIASALFARYVSFFKEERVAASKHFESQNKSQPKITNTELLKAYQFARIINHHQGFKLMQKASEKMQWNLNLSELARIWTNGCIVKSDLMTELVAVFKKTNNALTEDSVVKELRARKEAIKSVVSECILHDLPISSMSESINFLNSFAVENSSANLIQAQRDYFGAHTYQKRDDLSGKYYHTDWKN